MFLFVRALSIEVHPWYDHGLCWFQEGEGPQRRYHLPQRGGPLFSGLTVLAVWLTSLSTDCVVLPWS